ncbi:hypothetical protein Srot_1535 [Segniliparus rotundus DSM 44985]|uniref:Lipoprotein LpqN n=1 Tax=Segniliparus rotundus (strain ATCC BAA-972 / CDC 1076 / CIP 108378 / DSM 44985 / JCM 13578) TaxID=640132 RepID=D6Z7R8_SEGRD|nr:LpqN/LpqT family lipoprotein [Segniliparus rotundus]ADG97998.1 hypothetical protein Srot_1535 [Segniliparus rotundus DSM 44985]
MRLKLAALLLCLGVCVTAACTQTVRGRASLPEDNIDLAHDPQITNIGVDTPVAEPGASDSSHDSASDATGTGLNDYLKQHGVSAYPSGAGQGLTVTLRPPSDWQQEKPDGPEQQVAVSLPAGDDGLAALMHIDVYKLSANPPIADLVAAANADIDAAGKVQGTTDTPYQGNPSIAGIVAVTTKQGNRVVEVLRYTFVHDDSSSTTYIVHSVIVCAQSNWGSMRGDLLALDSSARLGD